MSARAFVLDTHIVLDWVTGGGKLSKAQRSTLNRARKQPGALAISAITLWEIAKLAAAGRIEVDGGVAMLVDALERHEELQIVPLTGAIVVESTMLGAGFHNDPADQLIVATARVLGATLLTRDERIRDFGGVAVL